MEFKFTIQNFIKVLKIIEKYSIPNACPYFIMDEYRIAFNVDTKKTLNMPDDDRLVLEELGIIVDNDGEIYTEVYNETLYEL